MGRPNKPWFRRDIGWWVTTIARKQYRLAKGKDKKGGGGAGFSRVDGDAASKTGCLRWSSMRPRRGLFGLLFQTWATRSRHVA